MNFYSNLKKIFTKVNNLRLGFNLAWSLERSDHCNDLVVH